MKDLILKTPRHQVHVIVTQEQLVLLEQAVNFFDSEIQLGLLSGSDQSGKMPETMKQLKQAIKEAK